MFFFYKFVLKCIYFLHIQKIVFYTNSKLFNAWLMYSKIIICFSGVEKVINARMPRADN